MVDGVDGAAGRLFDGLGYLVEVFGPISTWTGSGKVRLDRHGLPWVNWCSRGARQVAKR